MDGVCGDVQPVCLQTTVMIVDDSDLSRRMLSRALTVRFDSIVQATNGLEAVREVKRKMDGNQMFFAILMDNQMPEMTGVAATKVIRAMGYGGLLFGLTGNVLAADIAEFIDAGADGVFSKPFDIDAFYTAVNQAQAAHQVRRNSGDMDLNI